MKKIKYLIFLCFSLFLAFLWIVHIFFILLIYDLFIIDQFPKDFQITDGKEGALMDFRIKSVYSNKNMIEETVYTYEKNNGKLYVMGKHGFWIINYVDGDIILFNEDFTKREVDGINSYVDIYSHYRDNYRDNYRDKYTPLLLDLKIAYYDKIAKQKKIYKSQMKVLPEYSDLTNKEQEIYQRLRSPTYKNTSPKRYGFLFQPFDYLFR